MRTSLGISRSLKIWAAAIFVAATAGFSTQIAFAGWAAGSTAYYGPWQGISYYNYSAISTDHASNHYGAAQTYVGNQVAANVPVGWMGVQPVRTTSGGAVSCAGTWSYSSYLAQSWGAAGCTSNVHTSWASQGASRSWTGSYYSTHGTFLSPSQNS